MMPYHSDPGMTLYHGDVLSELKQLPDESVQCVVTSPPYWGLRDYGQPGQLGLELTPDEYVAGMVAVFAEVRRVLRADGTCWLNLGDSYNSTPAGANPGGFQGAAMRRDPAYDQAQTRQPIKGNIPGLKPKDLVGIPWRVAFALQADGWWLRSDIIWHKKNPMPESVTDRPTKAHEYLFLLAKGEWKSRIVQFSNLPSERFHFFEHFRPYGHPVSSATRVPVDLATAILDSSQLEHDVSLPPFYAEVWQQLPDGSDSDFVRGLPIEHRPAVWAARFLASHCTAEEFFCEIDRLRIAHSDGNHLLECWNFSSTVVDAPSISSDGEGTITIHYPGEICKIEFPFHRLIISRPSRCSYYYDADAVREEYQHSAHMEKYGGVYTTNNPHRNDRGASILKTTQSGRNKRSVWTVATQPYSEAHFATFPPKLIEPCILAGSKPGDVVLDPFMGAGTTALVAQKHGRKAIGIDISATYLDLAIKRNAQKTLWFTEAAS